MSCHEPARAPGLLSMEDAGLPSPLDPDACTHGGDAALGETPGPMEVMLPWGLMLIPIVVMLSQGLMPIPTAL